MNVEISFSKFAECRPKQCVLSGLEGAHSVCVCTTHQNMDLMFQHAKIISTQKNETYILKFHKTEKLFYSVIHPVFTVSWVMWYYWTTTASAWAGLSPESCRWNILQEMDIHWQSQPGKCSPKYRRIFDNFHEKTESLSATCIQNQHAVLALQRNKRKSSIRRSTCMRLCWKLFFCSSRRDTGFPLK